MISLFHSKLRHMQIDRFEALAMIESDRAAAQIERLNDLYIAGGDGVNRAAGGRSLIDTGMKIAGWPAIVQSFNTER
jgi:hypothetical protein